MKKILALIFSVSFLFISCEGDQGPPGPPGLDGGLIVGQMFERTVDFTPSNEFSYWVDFPNTVEVLPTDIVMIYIEVAIENGASVWEPLPHSIYFDDGAILEYSFDFSQFDYNIFLHGDIDLNSLDNSFTANKRFRIAILPVDNVENIDLNNMESLMEALRLNDVEELN